MDSVVLSKPARKLLKSLCRECSSRSAAGKDDCQARAFGGADYLQCELFPKWSVQDVDAACRELHKAGLISAFYANCMVAEIYLLPAGTIYDQQGGRRILQKGLSFLRDILPFFH